VVAIFASRLLAREKVTIFGDGEQTRDFVYVATVVEANMRAAEAAGVAGRVFNVASGRPVSINEVLGKLAALLGAEARAVYEPARAGDIRHSAADVRAAQTALGLVTHVSLEQGLMHSVAEGIPSLCNQ
jgi:nucleoside-diphosphate-sugar epimerase